MLYWLACGTSYDKSIIHTVSQPVSVEVEIHGLFSRLLCAVNVWEVKVEVKAILIDCFK